MKSKNIIVSAAILFLIVIAGAKVAFVSKSHNAHGHDDHGGHAHGHGHGHGGDEKTSQITVWHDRFEIFLEHPYLVANKPAEFITHVTDRVTLHPRCEGPVIFVLTDSSGKSIKHVDKAPVRDGIYIPSLKLPHAGIWKFSLIIPLDGKDYKVQLSDIKVYESQSEVDNAPSSEDIVGISFLKEQQWKLPFATEAVKKHQINSQLSVAIPKSAIVYEHEKPTAFVHLAGETFDKRYLELGESKDSFVQVVLGLSEGEYVTTKGAYAITTGESVVQLSEEDARRFGIEVSSADLGEFEVHIKVTGEITLNDDRLAHIVPGIGGIVQEVKKTLGDKVEKGEVMAVIESRELADAKAYYLASLERLELARSTFEREGKLWDEQITSEQDYLDSKKVFAEARIEMRSAEQKLLALGFRQDYLDNLPKEANQKFTSFEVTAPFSGVIIQKHLTLGELVKNDATAFTVADLDTVFVELQIHQKDIGLVRKGQNVSISGRYLPITDGLISYVEPVINGNTRTALARVVLNNSSGILRPGTFVNAEIHVASGENRLVVNKEVIQDIDELSRIFVANGHGFEARPVTIGRTNTTKVEILSGLEPGEKIVTKNGFRLKAELKKAAGGSHGGHGHAH